MRRKCGDGDAARCTDGFAVEDQFAGIALHQMQQNAGERGFAAARLTDDAERLTLEQGERDAVDGAHAGGFAGTADVEVLGEIACYQQRLRGAADVARSGRP